MRKKEKVLKIPRKKSKEPIVINKPGNGLTAVCIHIPLESAELLAKGISQIRHFDGASTCIFKLFEKNSLAPIIEELKAKDERMNKSIEELAKECQIVL